MKIVVNPDKCNGCRICEQICTYFHEHEFNPRRARIRIVKVVREGLSTPRVCNQCQLRIEACPEQALSLDADLGFIRLEPEQCTGCGICVEVCPQESIFMDPINGLANICDLCRGEPQCVKWCPEEGVLQYQ